jgi:hypothetical protein
MNNDNDTENNSNNSNIYNIDNYTVKELILILKSYFNLELETLPFYMNFSEVATERLPKAFIEKMGPPDLQKIYWVWRKRIS